MKKDMFHETYIFVGVCVRLYVYCVCALYVACVVVLMCVCVFCVLFVLCVILCATYTQYVAVTFG